MALLSQTTTPAAWSCASNRQFPTHPEYQDIKPIAWVTRTQTPTKPIQTSSKEVSSSSTTTYTSEATRQLTALSKAVGQDESIRQKLLEALEFSFGDWGQAPVPQQLNRCGWLSDVSNDHAPFEYSVALSQRTGACELRFLVESQPEENTMSALQASTSQLTADIATKYGPSKVSLDRFHLISDLFLPPNAQGTLASWHSFATSKTLEKWKIYLDPQANGKQNAFKITQTAMERLGLAASWNLLEQVMHGGEDYPVYFSLGLSPNPEEAEVKVYVAHPGASATAIAQRHARADPSTNIPDIEQFYSTMAGGSLGPYRGKPGLSCFHFKNKDPSRPVARTVLYPMDNYASNDAEAQARIEQYMEIISAPQVYRDRYRSAINAVRRRPLKDGRGIHSWVGMKDKANGDRSNTYYLSAELFGSLADSGIAMK